MRALRPNQFFIDNYHVQSFLQICLKLSYENTLLFNACCFFVVAFSFTLPDHSMLKPPVAKIIPKELTIHGHTRLDNYFWLNDRENPEVIKYLEEENAYAENVLAPVKDFREKLFLELKGRIKEEDASAPYKDGNYFYYHRFETGKEYPVYCRKRGALNSAEAVLLDCNQRAEGNDYYQAEGLVVSANEKLLAFAEDTVSRRIFTIRIKNLETGEMLPDEIRDVSGNIAWANDNKTLFYASKDLQTLREDKIYMHVLGTSQSEDKLIYDETDETFYVTVEKSKSEKFLFITSWSTLTSEVRFAAADYPTEPFKIFLPRERDHIYNLDHRGSSFCIVTNWDAKNFRLMESPVKAGISKNEWKEIIPHRNDVLLEELELFNDFMVLQERKDGLTRLRIINHKNSSDHYLDFGEPAYTCYIGNNAEMESKVFRFGYNSMTTPASVYDYDMETKEKTLVKQQEVLGGFDRNNYVTERIYATAPDARLPDGQGTKIPISLVYRKGFKKDGSHPLYQIGYGSYGISYDPQFSMRSLSLLDRGFVVAKCHIRGGQEMGRWWYEDGKLLKKKNTFTDFIACSEHLIREKYTSADKLFAMGGSAGGLLIGAVMNMRPDLYKGMTAYVPFVDVVTTMLDETIPLTTSEYDEWGNPNEKVFYDYMLSYSPYDNVEKKNYPNLIVITGLHDSQVQYWEPAKWVAKLRAMKTDKNLLLLQTDMEAGHGGASGRFKSLKDDALEFSFMFNLLGINK